MQKIIEIDNDKYEDLDIHFRQKEKNKIFLVCDESIRYLKIKQYFDSMEERIGIKVVWFSNFKPNPQYESIVEGVKLLIDEQCDLIVAVGGGSAIDVAKCIKLYSNMEHTTNYLEQQIVPNDIELWVMPTTAGTGSEATRYAVIYYQGEKQSVSDYSCIPSVVIFDSTVLETLPDYQKKATMLDAMCHAIESFWSVNSNDKSKEYAAEAIRIILDNYEAYISDVDKTINIQMMKAANLAGHAINITQTTAGHAMCYKITSLFGIAHGHAAALCVVKLFPYMAMNMEKCIDSRGIEYLKKTFGQLASAFGCVDVMDAVNKFDNMIDYLELEIPNITECELILLKKSVNPIRLKNNPVLLDENTIESLYRDIFSEKK